VLHGSSGTAFVLQGSVCSMPAAERATGLLRYCVCATGLCVTHGLGLRPRVLTGFCVLPRVLRGSSDTAFVLQGSVCCVCATT